MKGRDFEKRPITKRKRRRYFLGTNPFLFSFYAVRRSTQLFILHVCFQHSQVAIVRLVKQVFQVKFYFRLIISCINETRDKLLR